VNDPIIVMAKFVENLMKVRNYSPNICTNEGQRLKLSDEEEELMFETILENARRSYLHHKHSARGQQITNADNHDYHIVWATISYLESSKDDLYKDK
jgi:hypothetical protein